MYLHPKTFDSHVYIREGKKTGGPPTGAQTRMTVVNGEILINDLSMKHQCQGIYQNFK